MLYDADNQRGYSARDVLIEGILNRARDVFGWVPGNKYKFFDRRLEEPFSDNPDLLRQAISENLWSNDKVLTIPSSIDFFKEAGIEDITAFDISPFQLDTYAQNGKSYWCDIFDPGLLDHLLTETNPDVMYISNIVEWSYEGRNEIDDLAITLSSANSLNKVMFSTVTGGRQNQQFLRNFEMNGWTQQVYVNPRKSKEKVYVLMRS